jgi:hypothetical protein
MYTHAAKQLSLVLELFRNTSIYASRKNLVERAVRLIPASIHTGLDQTTMTPIASTHIMADAKSIILPVDGKKNILITSALPYVNNVPHLGKFCIFAQLKCPANVHLPRQRHVFRLIGGLLWVSNNETLQR